MYQGINFKGIYTHDPERAIELYCKSVGCEPTVLIVHPDTPVRSEHPLLIRSVAGGTKVYMLATHEITLEDAHKKESDWRAKQSKAMRREFDRLSLFNSSYPRAVHESEGDNKFEKSTAEKKPTCPHCRQDLHEEDFENLGWWWGWSEGIVPPYWDALRIYVFRRDDWRCWRCGEIYAAEKLNAHHVTPKELGGTDSAKNLRSTCIYCHEDLKPIMPEPEG